MAHSPSPSLVERFQADLERLAGPGRIGVAVSGGPDSLALLLLAHAARPGEVEAATVDHGLRPESADEARMVATVCRENGLAHATLSVTVAPGASLQAQAREARYAALERWATEGELPFVATGHHADDQAETLLMRLGRGAGLAGLAGVRPRRPLGERTLIRPLLGWRKSELEKVVAAAGLTPVDDPANTDQRHDRTRVRALLAAAPWLDPGAVAASAAHLAEAEEALRYAAEQLSAERMRPSGDGLLLAAGDLPRELQRRLLLMAIARLGDPPPRGPDLDRALAALTGGASCTLGTLKLEGGSKWRLRPAPPRKA